MNTFPHSDAFAGEPVRIISFSPLFGFYIEGFVKDLGPARGQAAFRRVRFDGDTAERERLVFQELQILDRSALKALNDLYFHRPLDLPRGAAAVTSHLRKSVLPSKGGR